MSTGPRAIEADTLTTGGRRSDLRLFWRILRQARPYWLFVVGIFLLRLVATPLALLTPVPLKIAVDSVLGTDPLPGFLAAIVPETWQNSTTALLIFAAALVVAVAVLSRLETLGSKLLQTYTGEKLNFAFQTRLFNHAQRLSLSYHDNVGTADSIYRIQYDARSIRNAAIYGVIPFVVAGITLIAMFYVTARIDAQLAIVALSISPPIGFLTWLYRRRLRDKWRRVKSLESSALQVLQETLTSLAVVKAFGQEDREQERFETRYTESLQARLHVTATDGIFNMFVGLTTAGGAAVILFLGVTHVQEGVLTLGALLLIMSYVGQLYGPLKIIGTKVMSLQKALAGAERAYALLDQRPDVSERPHAIPVGRVAGDIALRGVSFSYENGPRVLSDISFEAGRGTRVGLAGRTGAGKSTLMTMLTRFHDPTDGEVLLDGVDLRDYKLADLRNQFAIVHQETILFSTSVAENIAYARPQATSHEIEAAAEAANAHGFIMRLPEGYDTLVGEKGMRLSGGERQRIALARAFLKDAPILILDEPTSSVDIGTEATIMEAMERLMNGRTTFMVAHRLGTLTNCDVLLILEEGRLERVTRDVVGAIQESQLLQSVER